jgi:hypothetical protein
MLRSFFQGILVTGKGGKQKKSKKRKHRNRQRNKNFVKRKLVRTWRQEPAVIPLTATGSTTPHILMYVSCSHTRSLATVAAVVVSGRTSSSSSSRTMDSLRKSNRQYLF